MRRIRWLPVAAILIISFTTAFLLRDVVRDLFIVPLSYVWWLATFIYSGVPELVRWSLLVLAVCIAIIWQLLPEPRALAPKASPRNLPQGNVESLATWILQTRDSNYFKWQLANRLGRIYRKLSEYPERRVSTPGGSAALDGYLAAGLDHSFVDFPSPRYRFQRRESTPLDLDPAEVVDYLETQMEINRGRHAASI